MRLSGFFLLVCLGGAEAQTVYKCTDAKGNPVYSQRPCAEDAKAVEIKVAPPSQAPAAAVSGQPGGAPSAAQGREAGLRAQCERREERIRKEHIERRAALERQIADYRNFPDFVAEKEAELANLERSERQALLDANRQCREEMERPLPPPAAAPAGPRSWRCRVENGEVFYRHDACPELIRDEPDPEDPNAGPIYEHRVRAEAVSRAEACTAIATPGRDGNLRDQQRAPGEADPCL